MLPTQVNYPEFVPDQLLTSEHLNQLFGYLEEQERLTRTNLIGIGIVCGLDVKSSSDGTSLTITKGCGVTSEGYLIAVPEITYTSYKEYNAVQERLYDRFVDDDKKQRFPLYELKQTALEEGTLALTKEFLLDKVVLIYVEIFEEAAKNCDPDSCDDKGTNITLNFRPLLCSKADAVTLTGEESGSIPVKKYQDLKELKMRRFDVPASSLIASPAIFEAYQKVLNASFIAKTERVLNELYDVLKPIVLDLYPSDPFMGLAEKFKFLHNGTIDEEQLINIQYFYDLFSDLLFAYNELRKAGLHALSICCPDNLFPRHLLLGLAVSDADSSDKQFRQYFIPSPILSCHSPLTLKLRSLFKRLVLLISKFYVPSSFIAANRILRGKATDPGIRITPSCLGDLPLSENAIPFYYKVADTPDKLFEYWNYEKFSVNKASTNLSFHAKEYATDEEITEPLLFDLEPYNFFRIEGHIGKPYQHALKNILSIRNKTRLPFDVVALSGDIRALQSQIKKFQTGNFSDIAESCHFQDLESLYDALSAELICILCKEMKYFYDYPDDREMPAPGSTIPAVPLLKKCDPNFRFKPKTLGQAFEIFFATVRSQAYMVPETFTDGFFAIAVGNRQNFLAYALLYYMEKLSESLSPDLSSFNFQEFEMRYSDLLKVAEQAKKELLKGSSDSGSFLQEDVKDHLDNLIYSCKLAQFKAIVRDFLSRFLQVILLKQFAWFLKKHPGIGHKAGVTRGGTFILVYHESVPVDEAPAGSIGSISRAGTPDNTVESRRLSFNRFEEKAPFPIEAVQEKMPGSSLADFSSADRAIMNDLLKEAKDYQSNLDDLVAQLEDGTVIADFYLPYLCNSDCPPVNFILKEEAPKPSDPIRIFLKYPEYCREDIEQYEIEVYPQGGEVSGEGVTKDPATGTPVFVPNLVVLQATEQKKTVTITYTFDGDSAKADVVVFQKPTADFIFKTGSNFREVVFENKSVFGAGFEWDFGDDTKSEDANPVHSYLQEGTYKVILTAKNGPCSAVSEPREIIIKPEQQKSCLEVGGLLASFENDYSQHPLFEIFTEQVPYPAIRKFFIEIQSVIIKPADQQTEFFIDADVKALLTVWLNSYFQLIRESDFKELALAMYQVLVKLAMYVACVSEKDIDDEKLRLSEVFELIIRHLLSLEQLVPNFPPELKDLLKKMLSSFEEEQQRLIDSGEEQSKPLYLEMIKKLIEILKAMNL